MKKIILKVTLITFVLGFLSLVGCTRSVIHFNAPTSLNAGEVPLETQSVNTFVFGLFPTYELNAVETCRTLLRIVKIENKFSLGDIILSGITAFIYTPRSIEIYCNR